MTDVTSERADAGPARWKEEVLLGLELAALAAFAFSRPVLDSFGRSPETFVALQASGSDIILFGIAVVVIPVVVVVALGAVARLLAGRHRWAVQVVLVGALAGIGAWRMGQDQTGWPGTATKLVLLGLGAALLLGFLRWWNRVRDGVATFLRYGSVAVLVFAVQFLAGSQAAELAFGSGPVLDTEVAQDVAASLGDDPPSVLYVMFDALPTMSLLDGDGGIDGETFPNFGALADDATWYRNHSTVAAFTALAVPAMLTGEYPEPMTSRPHQSPDNLFTLLGGSYNLHVKEQITRMCPAELCPVQRSAGVGRLLGDAVDWWLRGADDPEERQFDLAGGIGDDRYEVAEEWIAGLQLGATTRPDLTFLHVVIPHEEWQFTDEGDRYRIPDGRPTGTALGAFWSESGVEVGEQRHMIMLQAADRLLGQLIDTLDDAGVYDETMIVVTADHGAGFTPGLTQRAMSDDNKEWIGWVPLLIKEPDQTEAAVNDDNVELVDIVPTTAEVLGIDLPWDVDGVPVSQAAELRDPYRKTFAPHKMDSVQLEPGQEYLEIDWRDHLDEVLSYEPPTASGADGVWRLTDHGDLVGADAEPLVAGEDEVGSLVVEWPEGYDDIDVDEPLPLEVVAGTDAGEDAVVAFALNGTIGAVGEVQSEPRGPGHLVHGLLTPWLFRNGDNRLTAYVVEGAPGEEELLPLQVSFG